NLLFTDTNGVFSLSVPTMSSNISLAISAPGYLPFFQQEVTPQSGMTYTLYPIAFAMTTSSSCTSGLTVSNAGASIQLQPCSVVDSNGQPYMGQFTVVINPYDPCNFSNSFPAGNAGVNSAG